MRLVSLILCVPAVAIFATGAAASTGNCKRAVKNAYPGRTNSRLDRYCSELGDRYGKKKKQSESEISGTVGNEKHYDPLGKMYIVHAGMHLPGEASGEPGADARDGDRAPAGVAAPAPTAPDDSSVASQLKSSFLGLSERTADDISAIEGTLLAGSPTPRGEAQAIAPSEKSSAPAAGAPVASPPLLRALSAVSAELTTERPSVIAAAAESSAGSVTIFERVSKRYRLLSAGLK